ncbi:MAG: putative type secretion system protein [Planctomycetota bacterium]
MSRSDKNPPGVPPRGKQEPLPTPSLIQRMFGGASLGQLYHFCNRLSTGLRAGVDPLRLLDAESKAGATRYRDAAKDTADKIRLGYTFSEAMQLQKGFFPPLLIKMISAGEESGQVDRVLGYMSDYYQDLKRTRQDFVSQITAPVIQLLLAILIICGMIFINGFFQAGGPNEKPFDITGVGLRGINGVMIFLGILSVIVLVLGTICVGIWKNWYNCHQTLVPLVRNVPVIGPVFTTTAMSRLSMTLSMMLGAGVEAKRSVRDAVLSTGNYYYISGLPEIESAIQQGKSLSESFSEPNRLPDEFIQTLEVGELSGADSESLERLAIQYREKAQIALKQLAVAAGFLIWFMIAAMIITVIFMVFMQYLAILTGNLPK